MTVAEHHGETHEGEAPLWASPLHAFIAWLAKLIDYVTRWKSIRHDHKFKPDWRDCWDGLRQCEWLRDQLTAQGLRQLLNGEELSLDATTLILDPPADYGGPCPRTPFDMNRRFLAIARWRLDPEALVRERYRRLIARLRIDPTDSLAARASTDAALCAAAQHELVAAYSPEAKGALILSRPQSGRPSKDERVLPAARGPPAPPRWPNPNQPESTRFRERIAMRKATPLLYATLLHPLRRWNSTTPHVDFGET